MRRPQTAAAHGGYRQPMAAREAATVPVGWTGADRPVGVAKAVPPVAGRPKRTHASASITRAAISTAAAPAAAVTSGGRRSRMAARKSSCSQAMALASATVTVSRGRMSVKNRSFIAPRSAGGTAAAEKAPARTPAEGDTVSTVFAVRSQCTMAEFDQIDTVRRAAGLIRDAVRSATSPDENTSLARAASSNPPVATMPRASTRSSLPGASDRTRSMSWIMRSWTTPTSMERKEKGPSRDDSMAAILPACASAIRQAGLNRSTWPTATVRPSRRAAVTMARASSTPAAIGFSTRRSTPPSSSGRETAACRPVGAATTAASTCPSSASGASRARQPWAAATRSRASADGSTTATSRTSPRAARSRAWIVPRCPHPTTATRVAVMPPSVWEGSGRAAPPAGSRGIRAPSPPRGRASPASGGCRAPSPGRRGPGRGAGGPR